VRNSLADATLRNPYSALGADPRRDGFSADPVPRQWLTTGRRLLLAFSVVVTAFAFAVAAAFAGIREVDAILAEMDEHEERMNLALAFESAVRDQYAHHAHTLLGDHSQSGDYVEARKHAADIGRLLALRADAADRELLQEVERAADAFNRLNDQVKGASLALEPPPTKPPQGYSLVASIENHLDRLFERNHAALVILRGKASDVQGVVLRRMMTLFVGATLFALAIGLYIRRAVARPIARLGEGARRLSGGEMETRIQIAGRDEFAVLAAQFNAMTDALKDYQQRLVQGEKLAAVGRLAAGVAHELNNPLTVMLGYLTLERDKGEGQLAKGLHKIEQEALRCKEIVQDLLALSRPEGAYGSAPVDVRKLGDDVVERLRGSGQFSSVRFDVGGSGKALGDAPRLKQVVVNLVRNAAEAAGPGGRVQIHVTTTPRNVEVAVSDSGPGVPESARARLFEPFFTTKPTGTGLGLAVSRAIVVAHGGDIAVREAEQGGALFAVTLPRADKGGARDADT
jgi:signal transduction histidine kinase